MSDIFKGDCKKFIDSLKKVYNFNFYKCDFCVDRKNGKCIKRFKEDMCDISIRVGINGFIKENKLEKDKICTLIEQLKKENTKR